MDTFFRRPIQGTRGLTTQPYQKSYSFWQRSSKIIIYLLIFFALLGVFLYVLPKAEVTIIPEKRAISGVILATIDTTVSQNSIDSWVMAGVHYSKHVQSQKNFPTTGKIDIGKRASGKVVFSNRTGIDWPLLTDHAIRGGENKIYHVTADILVPKATVSPEGDIVPGQIEVAIQADSGGADYDLPLGKMLSILTVPPEKQDKIFGYVSEVVGGGTTQVVQSVSLSDVTTAERVMIEEAIQQTWEEFEKKFKEDYFLSQDLIFISQIATTTTPQVNEPAQNITVSMEANLNGIAIRKKNIEEVISEHIRKTSSIGKDETLSSELTYNFQKLQPLGEGGYAAKVTIAYESAVIPLLPLEELKQGILGKKENKARSFLLSQKGVRDVRFKYKWNLVSSIPDDPERVTIKIQ